MFFFNFSLSFESVDQIKRVYDNNLRIIRILHECEVLIQKSVPRVTVWHLKALPCDAKL